MIALTSALVHTVTNGSLDGATILIEGSKILAVGQHISIPHDATILHLPGMQITPGLIDCHTHLGIAEESTGQAHIDKNEINSPICPHLRALDGINPEDEGLLDALCGGITSIIVTPGSENVIGGQSIAIKTYGTVIDHMILRQPAGMKIAFGENPINTYKNKDKAPSTRMTIAGMIREQLIAAQYYARKFAAGQVQRDLRLEALSAVLDGTIPLRAHAHASDDIMTAIRIADEFNVRLTIEHATAGHKVADEIARRSIPATIGPSITARVKVELKDRTYQTPAILHKAGVKIALITDHPFLPINSLRLEAALAMREGLPRNVALQAITIHAAEIMGVEKRIGSIETGKDADLVAFNGDPFAIETKVVQVWINGDQVYGKK